MGVDDRKNKLVGFGSDGASVNMAAAGSYLEADISLKDALKHTFFSKVNHASVLSI